MEKVMILYLVEFILERICSKEYVYVNQPPVACRLNLSLHPLVVNIRPTVLSVKQTLQLCAHNKYLEFRLDHSCLSASFLLCQNPPAFTYLYKTMLCRWS